MSKTEDFFRERRAAAVFKHGILQRYPVVFASKVGSTSAGHRVVLLDGYAGPGQYDDGSPGSPLLLAKSAKAVGGYRDVRGFFVERDDVLFENLQGVLAAFDDPRFTPLHGALDDYLAEILRVAGDAALFAFLDPFGTAIDRGRLVGDLLGRRDGKTEVLLHFSLSAVARTGGLVRKVGRERRSATSTEKLAIANVDRFLGGEWWRQRFADVENDDDLDAATAVAEDIAAEFCASIKQETGFRSVSMPVRMRPQHLPKYLMVLFTRHPEGAWHFADALGKAGLDWHKAWRAEEDTKLGLREKTTGQYGLFDVPTNRFDPSEYERVHRDDWIAGLKTNLTTLLDQVRCARLDEHIVEVYGTYLGSAQIKHVRAAIKELHAIGVIDSNGIGEFQRRMTSLVKPTIRPAP